MTTFQINSILSLNNFLIMIAFLAMFLTVQAKLYEVNGDTEVSLYYKGEVSLKLDSNPTTGYAWKMILKSGSYLKTSDVNGKYTPPKNQIPGAGGYQVFELSCGDKCTPGYSEEVKFAYKRPWENSPVNVRKVLVNAVAQPDGSL